jgi:hypothetical protein
MTDDNMFQFKTEVDDTDKAWDCDISSKVTIRSSDEATSWISNECHLLSFNAENRKKIA